MEPKQALNTMKNVINPNLWPEPDTIKLKELYKYKSLDTIKMAQSFRNYKSALPLLCKQTMIKKGGIGVGMLVLKFIAESDAHLVVFGENGNGGRMLDMHTRNTNYDFYYNRQFQKMRYLTEDPIKDPFSFNVDDEILAKHGYNIKVKPAMPGMIKKAPHVKYL